MSRTEHARPPKLGEPAFEDSGLFTTYLFNDEESMMNSPDKRCVISATRTRALARLIVVLAITCAFAAQALAQSTAADTPISNTASASYSDGGGGNYSTISNTVTVIVSKVSGL